MRYCILLRAKNATSLTLKTYQTRPAPERNRPSTAALTAQLSTSLFLQIQNRLPLPYSPILTLQSAKLVPAQRRRLLDERNLIRAVLIRVHLERRRVAQGQIDPNRVNGSAHWETCVVWIVGRCTEDWSVGS